MTQYLVFLGHQPHLSTAELAAVFSAMAIDYTVLSQSKETLLFETSQPLDTEALMQRLGGVVKIAQKLASTGTVSQTIVDHLTQTHPEGKIHFSLAPKRFGLTLKKELKALGRSVRYVEPKNTATVLHNNLVEKQGDVTIMDDCVFVTVGIQHMEGFAKRDYDRPGSDDLSGMLPPKLARMMINLSGADVTDVLLDPFCGSGTVLLEAASIGFVDIIGSDISQKAVMDSKKNMQWLTQTIVPPPTYEIHECDARTLGAAAKPKSVDIIVTEPYLGKPLKGNEKQETLVRQAQELTALYVETFHELHAALKTGGVLVCVIPQFRHRDQWIMLDCVEEIKNIGFSPTELLPGKISLLYHRPKQHVGRAIWRFVKK